MKSSATIIIFSLVVVIGFLSFSQNVFACEPMQWSYSLDNVVQKADNIFQGKVIEIGPNGSSVFPYGGGPEWVKVQIFSNPYKGNLKPNQIITINTNAPCGYGFSIPAESRFNYLFFTNASYDRVDNSGITFVEIMNGLLSFPNDTNKPTVMDMSDFVGKYNLGNREIILDNLQEGQFYTISQLNKNKHSSYRTFKTKGYVANVPKPPTRTGSESMTDYIHVAIVSDTKGDVKDINNLPNTSAMFESSGSVNTDSLLVGHLYEFTVRVMYPVYANSESKNTFIVTSAKEIEQPNLQNGQFYTVNELIKERKKAASDFLVSIKTRGYISEIVFCSPGTDTFCPPSILITEGKDDKTASNRLFVQLGSSLKKEDFKVSQFYDFQLKMIGGSTFLEKYSAVANQSDKNITTLSTTSSQKIPTPQIKKLVWWNPFTWFSYLFNN